VTPKETIQKWLDDIRKSLIINYEKSGRKASGLWGESLKTFINAKPESIEFGVDGTDYSYQLVNGRRPNRDQSKEGLRAFVGWAGSTWAKDWVKAKSFNINPYAVAYKIAREGYKGNPSLVDDVINDNSIDQLLNEIGAVLVKEAKVEIITTFK
jgi:hypothetical protein